MNTRDYVRDLWDELEDLQAFCASILVIAEEGSQLEKFASHVDGNLDSIRINLSNFCAKLNGND
jgi:hypothetical protein